ncbi:MAG: hypothetical protein ACQEXJ_22975 [Myxococcota bacterium]
MGCTRHTAWVTPLVAVVLLAWPAPNARAADDDGFALGLALGAPTAVDATLGMDRGVTLNLGLGADNFGHNLTVYAEGEFDLKHYRLGTHRRVDGDFYIGVGGQVNTGDHHDYGPHDARDDDFELVVVAPIGTDLTFEIPLQIFAELRPGIGLVGLPAHFHFGGQFGARYIF